MNKIYKVVWNNTLQCYTVVSELAKSHTKNNASKVVKATVLSSLLAVASNTYAAQGGVLVNNTSINIDSEAVYNNISVGVYNQGTLNFGDNLTLSSDAEPTSGILVNNQSTLNVKGNLSGTNTYLSTDNSKVTVNKDLKLDGKAETIFGSFNGSDIKVDGNASVSELVRFTADRDSSIEIGKDLNLNSTLSDASNSLRESVGIYNKSYMTVGGDVNVLGDSLIKSDGDASIEIGGDLNVKVDSHRNEIVGIYNNGSIKVNGNLTADRDNEYVETSDINLGTNAKLDVTGNAEFKGNTHLSIWDNSEATIGGNLKMSGVTKDGSIVYNNVNGNSSLNVAGDVNLSGTNNIHVYDNSELNFEKDLNIESTEVRDIFCVSEGAVGNIKGDMNVTGTTEDGHKNYYDMRNSGTLNVAGNVSFEGTNNLHVFDKSELNIGKNATFNGGEFSVTDNSNAKIDGDLTLTDSRISTLNTSSVSIGKNLTVNQTEDTENWNEIRDSSSLNVDGDLNMKGIYKEGPYIPNSEADLKYYRNKLFIHGNEASYNVNGNVNLTDNSHFFSETVSNAPGETPNGTYSKSDFESVAQGNVEGNVTVSKNSRFGVYQGAETTVKGNITANTGAYVELWNIDALLNVGGDVKLSDKQTALDIGNIATVNVGGNLESKNGSLINLSNRGKLKVSGNLSSDNSEIVADNNSNINVNGDLNITRNKDESAWNRAESGSSIYVGGNLNLSAIYKEGRGDSTSDEESNKYHRNKMFASGAGSSITVKGDTSVSNNAELFAETYSNPIDNPDHEKYFDPSNFKDTGRAVFEGDVNLSTNGKLGSYNAGIVKVEGNVNAQSGGTLQAWDSDAYMNILGNVTLTGNDSRIGIGRTADMEIDGRLTAKDGAEVYVGEGSALSVGNKFTVENSTLEIQGGQLLLSGQDSVLDLTNGGVLKTYEAGSIGLEKGASVNANTKTLLSEDTKTTAEGVAEKTFEADALSKVKLADLDTEVTLDEAKRLHGVLFNSDTGILDVKIKVPTNDKGEASFDDAIYVAGTTAVADTTVSDVDTKDKKLSDLTEADLSWGSASLKDGQSDLNLGSGNLALNNPESNDGLFVSTSDGSAGNISMDKDANLALNGAGAIGDISTSENSTGDVLIGNDKESTVTANNLGSDDKAFGSVSVGAGSAVSVKNILNAAKVSLEQKAEVIASVIKTPDLKAIGENISIRADKSVLGGLISGINSSLQSKNLELADNFNVLGGAKIKADILSLKGKKLFADPDWNSDSSVVVANNLSGENGDVLDGSLIAGQNSLVAVSSSLDENQAAALARAKLSKDGITALGYADKDIVIANNGSVTVDGSLTAAPENVEGNTVNVATNSALVLDNNATVTFENANGKVNNEGTVVVKADNLAHNAKITAFKGEDVTVTGNGYYSVDSDIFDASSNGDGTLSVKLNDTKTNEKLTYTDAGVAQSVKSFLQSGGTLKNGTILSDLVGKANARTLGSTLSQLTRLGTLAGSVSSAKLASDSTVSAIDSRLAATGVNTSAQAKAQSNRLTVWVQPVFSHQSSDSLDAGVTDYGIKTNLRGGVAGLDVTLGENFTQGVAISVGSGTSSSKNIDSVSGDFDYYGFNLYGAYVNNALKLSYDLGYTKVSNDATAYNALGKFTSDVDTKVFTLGIKGAYTFNTSFMDITPHVGVRYAKYDTDDYTATSGNYLINNEGASSSLVSFPVGVSFSKDISLTSWTVVPTVNLEVIPVAGDKDVDTRSSFDGVTTSVNTKLHDGINYSTFVGLDALYGDSLSVGINYNYTGSKNVDDHSVNASLRYTF